MLHLNDVDFVDDTSNYQCAMCGNLNLINYSSSCKHTFCFQCQKLITTNQDLKCRICQTNITISDKINQDISKKVFNLCVRCPNSMHGCRTQLPFCEFSIHNKLCGYKKDDNVAHLSMDFLNVLANLVNNSKLKIRNIDKSLSQINTGSKKFNIANIIFNETQINQNNKEFSEKVYNIVLLGPTGMGKSTFINAFSNYVNFSSLEEIMKSSVRILIPCKFTITNDAYISECVSHGSCVNENTNDGESATKSCRAYEFPINNNCIIRFIDTPGIGDTRGIIQDKLNVDNIIKTLSTYQEVHAICIILKSNEVRLTTYFAFCVKEIFSYIHRQAIDNIIFLFTNARNSFYGPGESITLLNTILQQIRNENPLNSIFASQKNVFCFDNEWFRFLVALENGKNFSPTTVQHLEQSWIKSVEESSRLIRCVVKESEDERLTPHLVDETLTVYTARQCIIKLAQFLVEINEELDMNAKVFDSQKLKLKNCESKKSQLLKEVFIKMTVINIKKLKNPATVCTGINCRRAINVNGNVKYYYPRKCHYPCFLKEVESAVIGEENIRLCCAIDPNDFSCLKCKCHVLLHVHVTSDASVYNTYEIDSKVKSRIKTINRKLIVTKRVITFVEAKIRKYKSQEKLVLEDAKKLAAFLKQNAVISCNDSFKEYLAELIENQNFSKDIKNNYIRVLQKLVKHFEKESFIFDHINASDIKFRDSFTKHEILKLKNKFFLNKDLDKCYVIPFKNYIIYSICMVFFAILIVTTTINIII